MHSRTSELGSPAVVTMTSMYRAKMEEELKPHHGGWFVPTMGCLHAGHEQLIRVAVEGARRESRPVVVSIFVNPTQFGPGEDYETYPRRLEADLAIAEHCGADVAFVPDVETIYPPDREIPTPPLPPAATRPRLEDAHRPSHFSGVCQVVARLFDLVRPQRAVFGEKDYQQLLVIGQMADMQQDRWPNLEIISHPTVREPDGLAMSSRNVQLNPDQRRRALGLSHALDEAKTSDSPGEAERIMHRVLDEHDLDVDYAVVRDARTLEPIPPDVRRVQAVALVAARVDTIRLIDNSPMDL